VVLLKWTIVMVVNSNEARQELLEDFGYSRRPFWSFRMSDWGIFAGKSSASGIRCTIRL